MDWPIAGLLHWGRDSQASSVAEKGDLRNPGMVDLRLVFAGLGWTWVRRVFRFRLLCGGWGRLQLIILGAPALDTPPLGIGHRPTLQGHYLPGLDVAVKRAEADAMQANLLAIAAIFDDSWPPPSSAAPRTCLFGRTFGLVAVRPSQV